MTASNDRKERGRFPVDVCATLLKASPFKSGIPARAMRSGLSEMDAAAESPASAFLTNTEL